MAYKRADSATKQLRCKSEYDKDLENYTGILSPSEGTQKADDVVS